MKTMRTEQIFIKDNGVISKICHISKNLYNQVNYILRNQFFNKEKLSSYKDLAKQFSKPSGVEEHHDTYMGKRIERGVFQSANGTLIHADLNASYNTIRKAVPEAFADGIEGIGLYPRSLSIKEMITSKGGC